MASSTPLKDMEENFFLCPVCLDQFKEPKLLPCLHRYCRDCLETVIEGSNDGKIKCPMCKEDYIIPKKGVNEFKTDFHMKSVIEFIELQKSFESKEIKKCVDCSRKVTVTAYCFKCRNFLCDQCYQRHMNSPMFSDHQPHVLNLENIDTKNLTLDKLATFTEDPRCHIHVKQAAQVCCCTCRNAPVCVTCIYGKHKGHDLHDVTDISKNERKSLNLKLDELNVHKSKLYELPERVNTSKRKLKDNLAEEREKLTLQYKEKVKKIKEKLDENTAEQEKCEKDKERRRKSKEREIKLKREEEINLVKQKYDAIMKTTNKKYEDESKIIKEKHDKIKHELSSKLKSLESKSNSLICSQDVLANENENKLEEMLKHCKEITKRYENFTSTTSSILAYNDEWTDVQCIPDIVAASEPLIEEMKIDFREIDSLTKFGIKVTISDHAESVIFVEGISVKGWWINDIAIGVGTDILVTGKVTDEYSHITLINRKGRVKRQDIIKQERTTHSALRLCSFLSDYKVATVCVAVEVGIYDVRDGSYKKRYLSDFIDSWPERQWVRCVATDPTNKRIFVGTNSRNVYVFDDELNYIHTMILPASIICTTDVDVHRGSLLVCDMDSRKTYAVTMDGPVSKLVYELTPPDLDGIKWRPTMVCSDKKGFIYMLLYANPAGGESRILAQYSQDGRQLLMTRPIDEEIVGLTILEINGREKLLLAARESGMLYTYGLDCS